MPEEPKLTCRYRILRYLPNLLRDEWMNVGVLLEEAAPAAGDLESASTVRIALRFMEEDADIARVRRLHPGADEGLLRALQAQFGSQWRAPVAETAAYIAKLEQTLSTTIQFSQQKGLLADNFEVELDRLFREQVAPPAGVGGGVVENTRRWIRARLNDVFRRHGVLDKLECSIPVARFTQPGDNLHLDYGYRYNGTRGYLHTVALSRDPTQAKVLAYTVEQMRKKDARAEFTAMTETEPASGNPRHQFVASLFAEGGIAIVPLQRAERFAEDLRLRIQ